MTALIGIIAGIGVMVYAIISVKAPYQNFLNAHGALIVIGGVVASTFTSFRARDLARGLLAFMVVFFRGSRKIHHEVESIASLATVYTREGLGVLEPAVHALRESVLKDGLTLFLNGYKWNEIQITMEASINLKWDREQVEVRMFRQMGKAAPAFGMVGTVVGLIFMLSQLRDQPEQIGPYLAVALTATLYGLFLANAVFYPMAEKLSTCADENVMLGKLWLDGIQLILEKRHPLYVKDRLSAYMPARERWKIAQRKPAQALASPPPTSTAGPTTPPVPRRA